MKKKKRWEEAMPADAAPADAVLRKKRSDPKLKDTYDLGKKVQQYWENLGEDRPRDWLKRFCLEHTSHRAARAGLSAYKVAASKARTQWNAMQLGDWVARDGHVGGGQRGCEGLRFDARRRATGGGRMHKAPEMRQELYHWFTY